MSYVAVYLGGDLSQLFLGYNMRYRTGAEAGVLDLGLLGLLSFSFTGADGISLHLSVPAGGNWVTPAGGLGLPPGTVPADILIGG